MTNLSEIKARHEKWETPEKHAGLVGLTWAAGDQAHSDRAALIQMLETVEAERDKWKKEYWDALREMNACDQ